MEILSETTLKEQMEPEMDASPYSLLIMAIKFVLQKDPRYYEANSLQRVVGIESDAKQRDVIKYYKPDFTAGGTSNSNLISHKKYSDMLKTSVEDSLTLGNNFLQEVIGMKEMIY